MYGLVDCNNFYASCERVFDPELRNRPVVVLSNNDGCVIARSDESKALGIEMGEPYFQCEDLIDEHDVAVLSSNYALYGDMSRRVMDVLSRFTNRLEEYSIDEAFLEFPDFSKEQLQSTAETIKREVKKWVGIPVSVGIGPTKTIAKVANERSKEIPELEGTCVISEDQKRVECLKETPVDEIWGIGSRYAEMLNNNGVETAREFTKLPRRFVRENMTVVGLRTQKELQGTSCIELEEVQPKRKRIMRSRSFRKPITELSDLKEAVSRYASRAAEKLREEDLVAANIYVFIRTSRFSDEEFYSNGSMSELPRETSYTPALLRHALYLLENIYESGHEYKKAGVMLGEISEAGKSQKDLYESDEWTEEKQALMSTLDELNEKFGKRSVHYASEGIEQDWKMKRNRLSPRYTTRWEDLPVALA